MTTKEEERRLKTEYEEKRIMEYNAKQALITAAPDLLEASKFALSWLELLSANQNPTNIFDTDFDIIRSAIAKAEGR